jgi:hypothetical protein
MDCVSGRQGPLNMIQDRKPPGWLHKDVAEIALLVPAPSIPVLPSVQSSSNITPPFVPLTELNLNGTNNQDDTINFKDRVSPNVQIYLN